MKRILLSVFLAFCFAISANAQIPVLELHGGTSYYIGELNPYQHFNNPKFAGGVNLKLFMNPRFALRGGYSYLRAEGNDSESSSANQVNRNLYFRSDIHELHAGVELSFFKYKPGDMQYHPYTPYLFVGLAFFRMNPQGVYNEEYIDLQPLGTEGQGTSANAEEQYRLNQISIPFGLGFRVNMNELTTLGLEFGMRKTFTDYLDDVSGYYADPSILEAEAGPLTAEMADQSLEGQGSGGTNAGVQRGNPNNQDWYAYAGITFSFILRKESQCRNNFRQKRF